MLLANHPIISKFESFGKKMRFFVVYAKLTNTNHQFSICVLNLHILDSGKKEEDELCVQMNEQSIELGSFSERKKEKRKRPRTRIAISRIISEIFVTCFSCIFWFLSRFFFHSVVTDIACPRCDAIMIMFLLLIAEFNFHFMHKLFAFENHFLLDYNMLWLMRIAVNPLVCVCLCVQAIGGIFIHILRHTKLVYWSTKGKLNGTQTQSMFTRNDGISHCCRFEDKC